MEAATKELEKETGVVNIFHGTDLEERIHAFNEAWAHIISIQESCGNLYKSPSSL